MPNSSDQKPLNILFIHQNFPGQYRHLAPALAAKGHRVVALGRRSDVDLPGVRAINYPYTSKQGEDVHPLAQEFEVKVIRGEAIALQCQKLAQEGFTADVIFVHPGWGEALFLREVFPSSRIIVYCEYYYALEGQDVGYDPEFPRFQFGEAARLRLKNTCGLHAFGVGDVFVSPSRWQRSTFPPQLQQAIQVIHEGFDFSQLVPDPSARLVLPEHERVLTRDDKVLTYVARNLEPTRGFHWFMRALPKLLQEVPDAQVVIAGASGSGYGSGHPSGKSWYEFMLEELKGRLDLDRVHFLGHVARDVYLDVLSISSVHAYLSYPFVLSWSALEAHLMGCNLVVLDNEASMELLDEHHSIALDNLDADLSDALIAQLRQHRRDDELAAARKLRHPELNLNATLERQMSLIYEG